LAFSDILDSMAGLVRGEESAKSPSRRDMLSGIGILGAFALAGPMLVMPRSADAVELAASASDVDGNITLAGQYRYRRPRRSTRRYRYGRRRPRARFRAEFHYSPRPRYAVPRYSGARCDHWARMCARNWGTGNANFRGCMRYHRCW
jgi:hypothetical protein